MVEERKIVEKLLPF